MGHFDRCGAFHLPALSTQPIYQVNKAPRRAYCMGPGRSDERGGSIDTVGSIEAAEASIDAFIQRRAKGNAAENAREMMWKASVRKHHAKLDRERLLDRLAYHEEMLRSHSETFEALLKKHRVGIRLVEAELGITNEGEDAA